LTIDAEWRADASDQPVEPIRVEWEATDPDWKKWGPSQPTSPHWYDDERVKRLMAAEITHAEDHGKP
jgi:hypothetical protein